MSFLLHRAYDELAPDYERTRVPRLRPFVKKLLQLYDTRPGSWVLDAGCGTGLAATMVAPRAGHSGRVLGVDVSEGMLEIARHKARGFGFDQCEFVQGDIGQLNVPEAAFDLVICSFALWGEPKELLAGFRRALKPNGALVLQNWEPERGGTASVFNRHVALRATAAPDSELGELREVFRQYAAQWGLMRTPEDYVRLLREVGFSGASGQWQALTVHFADADELVEFHSLGVKARAELGAMEETDRAQLLAAVREEFEELATPRGIDVEWKAIQAIARN